MLSNVQNLIYILKMPNGLSCNTRNSTKTFALPCKQQYFGDNNKCEMAHTCTELLTGNENELNKNTGVKHIKAISLMRYYFIVLVKGKCFFFLFVCFLFVFFKYYHFLFLSNMTYGKTDSNFLWHSNMIRFKSVAIVSCTSGYCYSQHTQVALLIPFIPPYVVQVPGLPDVPDVSRTFFFKKNFNIGWLKGGKIEFDSIVQHRFESENQWPCVFYQCLTSEFESTKV